MVARGRGSTRALVLALLFLLLLLMLQVLLCPIASSSSNFALFASCLLTAGLLRLEHTVQVLHQQVVEAAALGDQPLDDQRQLEAGVAVVLKEHSPRLAKVRIGGYLQDQRRAARGVALEEG